MPDFTETPVQTDLRFAGLHQNRGAEPHFLLDWMVRPAIVGAKLPISLTRKTARASGWARPSTPRKKSVHLPRFSQTIYCACQSGMVLFRHE
jgi:hypothetical protein